MGLGRAVFYGAALVGTVYVLQHRFSKLRRKRAEQRRRQELHCLEPEEDVQIWKRREQLTGIGIDDFDIKITVGTGTFGRVRLALLGEQPVVLKIMKKAEIVRLKQNSHIHSEKQLLSSLQHPFIVKHYGSFQTGTHLYLVNEYLPGGEIFTHLRREGRFAAPKARFYTAELACALQYLHARHILFRETKPENCVLDAEGHLRLVDLGFSKDLGGREGRTWTLCGTPEYLAPEILLSQGHGLCCDWWTFGVLLFELLNGHPPFYGESPMDIYQKILSHDMAVFLACCDANVTDLIERLLVADVTARLGHAGAEDVMAHAWFEGTEWAAVVRRGLVPPFVPALSGSCDTSMFNRYPESVDEPAACVGESRQPSAAIGPEVFAAW